MTMKQYVSSFIKQKPLAAALLLNVIWAAFTFLFCDPKYEISDDFVIASILSGGYGTYTSFAPYVNVFLGKILKLFYMVFPGIGWFYIYQVVLAGASLISVTYVLLKKNKGMMGLCLTCLLFVFFADDLYVLPAYTKTAAFAVLSGGILILFAFENSNKHYIYTWLAGVLLLVGGGLLRKESFILGIPFLGLYFLYQARQISLNDKMQGREKKELWNYISKLLIICLAPLIMMGGFIWINHIQWNKNTALADYTYMDKLRVGVTDTAGYGYNSIEEQYKELGLDETDYKMINSWMLMDQGQYPGELLEKIASEKQKIRNEKTFNISDNLQRFLARNSQGFWPAIGALVIFGLLCVTSEKNRVYNAGLIGFSLLLLLNFYIIDRVVYRVEFGVFVGAALGMLSGAAFSNEARTESLSTAKRGILFFSLFLVVLHSVIWIPDRQFQTMTDDEYRRYRYDVYNASGGFRPNKYWANTNERKAYPNLAARVEGDTEHYYLFDFHTTIQATYYDYKPWESTPMGFYDHFSYFGGITSFYPGNQTIWEKKGIDSVNPMKSIVNDNILVVDTVNYNTKLEYLRKYYYPNARIEKIATIDGFHIWKYYKE